MKNKASYLIYNEVVLTKKVYLRDVTEINESFLKKNVR